MSFDTSSIQNGDTSVRVGIKEMLRTIFVVNLFFARRCYRYNKKFTYLVRFIHILFYILYRYYLQFRTTNFHHGLFVGFISFNFCFVPNFWVDLTLSAGGKPSLSNCLFSANLSFRISTYCFGGCSLGFSPDDGLGFFDDDGGICCQDDILNTAITKNKLLYFYAYDVDLHVCSL